MGRLSQLIKHPDEVVPLFLMALAAQRAKQLPVDQSRAFCYDMLNRVSRSFAMVIQQLPLELRDAVAFHERIFDRSYKLKCGYGPYLDLMRMYPLVTDLFLRLKAPYQKVITDITRRMGAGMAEFLEKEVETVNDFDMYCHYVAGMVGIGLSKLFATSGLEAAEVADAEALANNMGLFLQKINIIRDYLEDITEEPAPRMFWPREVWGRYTERLDAFKQPAQRRVAVRCLNALVANALAHAPRCLEYMAQLREPNIFRFCAIPQVMAMGTLAMCFDNPCVFTGVVKMRRGETAKLMLRVNDMREVFAAFGHFAAQLAAKCEKAGDGEAEVAQVAARVRDIQAACAQGLRMPAGAIGGPRPRRFALSPSLRLLVLLAAALYATVEYQLVGEATLQTLRAANETLVEPPDAEEPRRRRRKPPKREEKDDPLPLPVGLPAEDAMTAAEAAQQALELGKDEGSGPRWPLFPTLSASAASPAQAQSADASRTLRSSLAGSFTDGDGVRVDGFVERVAAWVGKGSTVTPTAAAGERGATPDHAHQEAVDSQREGSVAGSEASESSMASIAVLGSEEGEVESSERPERLELDRRRAARALAAGAVDAGAADAADRAFLRLMLRLLSAAHYAQVSARDAAMSRSLNSDYLGQLLIQVDTARLDARLVAAATQGAALPDEARALLVFKRGYGQSRRAGRMLVAKLDYLQLLAVKGVLGWLGRQATRRIPSLRPPRPPRADDTQGPAATGRSNGRAAVDAAVEASGKRPGEVPKRLTLAGGGLFMTLSNWGLLPQPGVLPLEDFNEVWRPAEAARLAPVYVERVSIREALSGPLLPSLAANVELVEPTFQELLVMYRQMPKRSWLARLRRRMGWPGSEERARAARRAPVMLRIFRDIPVPSWRIVFPEKLLQFRPLDGLRADLITVAGVAAFAAEAKYDSLLLDIISFVSACALATRIILGYRRMSQRFEQMASTMLADTTIAGQEAVVDYLAGAAALEQWAQASLALLLLRASPAPLAAEQLAAAVEALLEQRFQVRIRFDAEEALGELQRLGLLVREELAPDAGPRYLVLGYDAAFDRLNVHWDSLLLRRMGSILSTVQ
ncbi:hypothetical protein WJX81_003825 [Elliptochloris bilobata]|uniref:squalene synthase n=1 Tax=Elliptochloris bilobata TaxID=381761 RepID=A0AAW1QZ79_9CHLO